MTDYEKAQRAALQKEAAESVAKRLTDAISSGEHCVTLDTNASITHRTWMPSREEVQYRKVAGIKGRRFLLVAARIGARNGLILQFVTPAGAYTRKEDGTIVDTFECFEMTLAQTKQHMKGVGQIIEDLLQADFEQALKEEKSKRAGEQRGVKEDLMESRAKDFSQYGTW